MTNQYLYTMYKSYVRGVGSSFRLLFFLWCFTVCSAFSLSASEVVDTRRPLKSLPKFVVPQIVSDSPNLLSEEEEDFKTAYGILAYDYTDYSFIDGLVSFRLEGGGTYKHIELLGTGDYSVTAAAYAGDYYYYVRSTSPDGQTDVPVDLMKYDFQTGEVTEVGKLTAFDRHLNDMTYDYSSGTMYAITRPNNGTSVLYSINLETAEPTRLFDLGIDFFTLACSYEGQLYAIDFYGTLYKICKEDGTTTEIGSTGLHPQYYQSMEFDHSTGELFWAACLNEDYGVENSMVYVDTETGEATLLGPIGNQGEIAGLYIPFSASPAGTPAAVSHLLVAPAEKGTKMAALTWNNPLETFDGKTLESISEVKVYRNRELVKTFTDCEPGKKCTYFDMIKDDLAGGNYTYRVVASNETGDGARAEETVFVGKDVPLPVTNLTLQATAPDALKLTWEMPEKGPNGGFVDVNSLTYRIVRHPDEVIVAEAQSGENKEYVETDIKAVANYSFTVTASNNEGTTEGVTSVTMVFGPALSIPFSYDFTDKEAGDYWAFTNTSIEGGWTWSSSSTKSRIMGHQPAIYGKGDDLLTSHRLPFVAGEYYRVDFDYHAYSQDTLQFELIENGETVQVLHKYLLQGSRDDQHAYFSFKSEKEGLYSLGVRALSPVRADWVELHQLSLRHADAKNLCARGLTGETRPTQNVASDYEVKVYNGGYETAESYTVALHDQSGNKLAEKEVSEPLAFGEETTVVLSWTPVDLTVTKMAATVILDGDELPEDNVSDWLAVNVREAFNGKIVAIGVDEGKTSNSSPFDFFKQYAAALNIYGADEIGMQEGYISRIAYFYDTTSQYDDVENGPVKVYIANTDLATTEGGWLPEEAMTLAYEGEISLAKGEQGELVINFNEPFHYTGGNLAILTTVASPRYYSYVYYRQYTSPLENNGAYTWGDYYEESGFDFTQEGYMDWWNRNTSILLYMEDQVQDAISTTTQSEKAEGYTIYDLSGRKVASSTTGNFNVKGLRPGIYVITYEKEGKTFSEKLQVK